MCFTIHRQRMSGDKALVYTAASRTFYVIDKFTSLCVFRRRGHGQRSGALFSVVKTPKDMNNLVIMKVEAYQMSERSGKM